MVLKLWPLVQLVRFDARSDGRRRGCRDIPTKRRRRLEADPRMVFGVTIWIAGFAFRNTADD